MVKSKPLDLPPEVAPSLVEAINDYFTVVDGHERDVIAAHQLEILKQYERKLELADVKKIFERMKDHL